VRKTLKSERKNRPPIGLGAEAIPIGRQELLDTGHPVFKAVTAIRNRAIALLASGLSPRTGAGLRLIRQEPDRKHSIQQLADLRLELAEAVDQAQQPYAELEERCPRASWAMFDPADSLRT